IQAGDKLMGVDSNPRNVLSTCSGIDNLYKITPLKGESFICNEPHILSLKCNYSRYGYEKNKIYNIPLNDYLKLNKSKKHILKLYRSGPIFFDSNPVNIDPYLLGIWLGDGSSASPTITNMDKA